MRRTHPAHHIYGDHVLSQDGERDRLRLKINRLIGQQTLTTNLYIAPRFCGFTGSGNGGYVCGRIAAHLEGRAEVTLKKPIPLNTALPVSRDTAGHIQVMHGSEVIAEARPVEFDLEVPGPPTFEQAQAAADDYTGKAFHPAPRCFVCGPERERGDGLCIHPARVHGRDGVAAPWFPDQTLLDDKGHILPEFIWSALDCPGGLAAAGEPIKQVLLGRLAVKQLVPEIPLAPYIVIGWVIHSQGRKHHAGTALFTEHGDLCAYGRATWIAKPTPP